MDDEKIYRLGGGDEEINQYALQNGADLPKKDFMEQIKIKYTAQHNETGMIKEQMFTIEQIEDSNFVNQWQKKFKGWIITKREVV